MKPWTISAAVVLIVTAAPAAPPDPSTFSIVAADPATGEVGVAVASRFFAVGAVVPFARGGLGAIATQATANTSFGPRGLELLAKGLTPEEVVTVLLRNDSDRDRRQLGVVSAAGDPWSYTGPACGAWAGGRTGPAFAVQGNILAGEAVVLAVERSFLESPGKPLAERLLLALRAGDAAGGDSRGRQSAALLVAREHGGYGGFLDNAIDVRVDDHPDPFGELERLVGIALVNDLWNQGWTAFTDKRFEEARRWQEQAARRAQSQPTILPEVLYDLAVIRLAAGDREGALQALDGALAANPKLTAQARTDSDLAAIRQAVEERHPTSGKP